MSWDMHTNIDYHENIFTRALRVLREITVIEWLIILAILGIIASVAAPAMGWIEKPRQMTPTSLPADCKITEVDHTNNRTAWTCPDGVKHWKRTK